MVISTTRFGDVSVTEDDILILDEGLLGFADLHKFVLLDDPGDEIFAWLQSCDLADIAFPVLEPELFDQNFSLSLTKHDLAALGAEGMERLRAFSIITIPNDPKQMTANLKAPLVINVENRKGRQCVLQDNNLNIKEPIFHMLQQRVVQTSQVKSKSKDLAVSLPLMEFDK
jgi:flagellar assembly factor FliW